MAAGTMLKDLKAIEKTLEDVLANPPKIDLSDKTLEYIKVIRSISLKASVLEQEVLNQVDNN